MLGNLKARGCPRNLYGLTQSYLKDRKADIIGAEKTMERDITKGCPGFGTGPCETSSSTRQSKLQGVAGMSQ